MTNLPFPPIEDSSPEASALANFRLAATETSDARFETEYLIDETFPCLDNWARKYCPTVERAEDDDGIVRLTGDRDEVESYAETLCSDYGWRQVDAYSEDVPGSEERYWVVELERES